MNRIYKIVILDDHSLFLKGITKLIHEFINNVEIYAFTSISELESGNVDFTKIDLLVSDIELPNESVFEFLEKIKSAYSVLPILIVTMHKKISIIKKCKELQIEGYLLKDDDDYFQEAINTVLQGKSYYSNQIELFYKSFSEVNYNMSQREEDVIKLICKGLSNKEIADNLFISIETVKSHKKNIKSKLGYTDASELIKYANEHFIIQT